MRRPERRSVCVAVDQQLLRSVTADLQHLPGHDLVSR